MHQIKNNTEQLKIKKIKLIYGIPFFALVYDGLNFFFHCGVMHLYYKMSESENALLGHSH